MAGTLDQIQIGLGGLSEEGWCLIVLPVVHYYCFAPLYHYGGLVFCRCH